MILEIHQKRMIDEKFFDTGTNWRDFAFAIREDLKNIVENQKFKKHMKDILEYRTMEYYYSYGRSGMEWWRE